MKKTTILVIFCRQKWRASLRKIVTSPWGPLLFSLQKWVTYGKKWHLIENFFLPSNALLTIWRYWQNDVSFRKRRFLTNWRLFGQVTFFDSTFQSWKGMALVSKRSFGEVKLVWLTDVNWKCKTAFMRCLGLIPRFSNSARQALHDIHNVIYT